MSILQLRLKNCIQTLLEIELQMTDEGRDAYGSEFSFLKDCLDRIDHMDLAEDEVLKLEDATSAVIAEIGITPCGRFHSGYVQ